MRVKVCTPTFFLWSKQKNRLKVTTPIDDFQKHSKSCEDIKLPEEPTSCCMSGCANCVWIEYANELSKVYVGSNEKMKEIVLSKVNDPNMKAFLMMELKNLNKNSSNK